MKSNGFTIVELLVSMGILVILFALTTINLVRLPSTTSQSSSYDRLVSDLRAQQTEAMVGYDSGSPPVGAISYGVHFENAGYTLFTGGNYTSNVSSHYTVGLDPNLSFTNSTFPTDSDGSYVVFNSGSGDSLNGGSITITNSLTNELKTLTLNKYGATE